MKRRSPLLALALALAACGTSRPGPDASNEAAAVARVLQQDDMLGATRNRACESAPLTEAIAAYVQGLAALDFSGCPNAFIDAFARHRAAWEASIPFFADYDDLRGEMHDLFERIRASGPQARVGLEAVEADIWGTWAEVEATRPSP